LSPAVKNFENRLKLVAVMNEYLVACFWLKVQYAITKCFRYPFNCHSSSIQFLRLYITLCEIL